MARAASGVSAAAACRVIVPRRLWPGRPSRREEDGAVPVARTKSWCLLRCRCGRVAWPPRSYFGISSWTSQAARAPARPSARVAGGDTGTLLHVTRGSVTLLEKQVLAAVLKSQQCKNKWGAAALEIYWKCHQIMRFKRDLWKCCSFFPPWCGGCSGSMRSTSVQHDMAAGPWVLAGSAHGGGHLLIERYFHLHLSRHQPEQRGRGAEAAGLRAGRAGGRGVAAVRCEPGTRSRNNGVMDLTLGCSYPPPTR